MPVSTEHRARVEELVADYRRSRERVAELKAELATLEETVSSERATVSVTVGSGGALRDLWLSDRAYQQHRPAELAELILRLAGTAAERAARRADEVVAEALPPGSDPAALRGRPPEIPVATAGRRSTRPAGDEDAEEPEEHHQRSWLRD